MALKKHKDTQHPPPQNRHAPSRPVITVDYERYADALEHSDLSDDQKQEFLQALWEIIVNFVDLGWSVHALQQRKRPVGRSANMHPARHLARPMMYT